MVMKKQINILLLLILTLVLSSCITSQDDVNKAKQNLWIIEWTTDAWSDLEDEIQKAKDDIKQDSIEEIEKDLVENNTEEVIEETIEEVKKIQIKSLTDNQLLELDDLSWVDLLWWEVEITWKTLWKVDKIVVNFSNEESEFPDDSYTLKQFKPGWETFLYRAFSRYETLDFGKNVYIFEAYSWDEITKLELVLNVLKEDENKEVVVDYEDIDVWSLPSNGKFWNPTDLWNGKIWYSDLNWLEIKREVNPDFTCEKVTSILADEVSGYFYWNTCRPIEWNEWISFYVIRLEWDKYIYEKHYYLSYQGLYWVQELETWTWVTSINIWEKNAELKEKNEEFGILEITDDLFKEILK